MKRVQTLRQRFGPQLFVLLVTALWFAMQIVAFADADSGTGVRPK